MSDSSSQPKPKTIGDWLANASQRLEAANIGTARLDALVLLSDALGKDKSWLLAHPETRFQGSTLETLDKQLKQRIKHLPLAYVRGKTEFYGREFIITKDVLEPRPESETMIDMLKTISKVQPWNIVDVGTGSGALAITAKLEFPNSEVAATDIDPNCLKLARQNARKHGVSIDFYEGNLVDTLPVSDVRTLTSILLANLPYVPDSYQLNDAAMMEPRIAIYGGSDGLDLYRSLFTQLESYQAKYVLTESLPFQHKTLNEIAKQHNYEQVEEIDFIQLFRNLASGL